MSDNPQNGFDDLVDELLDDLTSNSRRAYETTFKEWRKWCLLHKRNPLDLRVSTIRPFLIAKNATYETRRRHLAALRSLAHLVAAQHPDNKVWQDEFKRLKEFRAPTQDSTPSQRNPTQLSVMKADQVLAAWSGETLMQLRNRALVALLFMTGMRRSEVCSLQLSKIDLTKGVIQIEYQGRNSGGSLIKMERPVAIPGTAAIAALRAWIEKLPSSRTYVFPSINKADKLGPDLPMTDQTVYLVVQKTQQITGMKFSPQAARRTFLFETLETGSPIQDIQIQVGHKNLGSTLHYVAPADAQKRRLRLKLRYGSTHIDHDIE